MNDANCCRRHAAHNCAYRSVLLQNLLHPQPFPRCGWGRNRTADTRIFSPLLCQLSYPAELPRYYRDASRGGCSLKQKTLNPQRRVAAAIYRRSQSAATETSRLDRTPPYHCRPSIPACCFFAAGGSACPTKFPRVERIQLGRCSAEPGKDLRLDGVSPYHCRASAPRLPPLKEASLQINGPLEQR